MSVMNIARMSRIMSTRIRVIRIVNVTQSITTKNILTTNLPALVVVA